MSPTITNSPRSDYIHQGRATPSFTPSPLPSPLPSPESRTQGSPRTLLKDGSTIIIIISGSALPSASLPFSTIPVVHVPAERPLGPQSIMLGAPCAIPTDSINQLFTMNISK